MFTETTRAQILGTGHFLAWIPAKRRCPIHLCAPDLTKLPQVGQEKVVRGCNGAVVNGRGREDSLSLAPHTEDAEQSPQGPRAPPVWRRNKGRGVLWGSGQRLWGGREQAASARMALCPGDSGAPGAWGCQGPLASAPRL